MPEPMTTEQGAQILAAVLRLEQMLGLLLEAMGEDDEDEAGVTPLDGGPRLRGRDPVGDLG